MGTDNSCVGLHAGPDACCLLLSPTPPAHPLQPRPGAYAGKTAEELGQGEAIAYNLREMFGLRVPIISVVIGEGGSGGALAIGCANRNLIMENAVYYVASPEACAAILWKSRSAAGTVRGGWWWERQGRGGAAGGT